MSKHDKAEEKFQAILGAAKALYEAVCDVRKTESKYVLRRLEQIAYETHEGPDDSEFSASVCLNELDVIDAARQRLADDHGLPFNGDDLSFRWTVANALAKRGITIDPTFADIGRHEWDSNRAIIRSRNGKSVTHRVFGGEK